MIAKIAFSSVNPMSEGKEGKGTGKCIALLLKKIFHILNHIHFRVSAVNEAQQDHRAM